MDGNKTATLGKHGGRSGNCRFLLAILIALVVTFPFLLDVASPPVLAIPLACVFLAGVIVTDSRPAYVRRAALLAGLQVGLTLVSIGERAMEAPYNFTLVLALLSTAALILLSMWCVFRYVMRARIITRDQIYAGICMYVMLGFAFGSLFYLVYLLDPTSFGYESFGGKDPDLMYFSFVTLATLGYGDITPRSPAVRGLAVLEALVGMIYIAVFMARLVSLRSIHSD